MPSPILTTVITAARDAMVAFGSATVVAAGKLADLSKTLSLLAFKGAIKGLGALKDTIINIAKTDVTQLPKALATFFPVIGQARAAFNLLKGTITNFTKSTLGQIAQIESGTRQAATTIATNVELTVGQSKRAVEGTLDELDLIEPKLKDIQESLIEAAPKLVGVTTGDLLATFNQVSIQFGQLAGQIEDDAKGTIAALRENGTVINDEFDAAEQITMNLASAMKVVGLQQREINQEVRALFTGDIDVNARLARQLNITREQIVTQKAQGTLAAFLLEKTSAIAAANERYNDSLSNTLSVLKDVADGFGRAIGTEAIKKTTKSLFDLRKVLEGMQDTFQEMGTAIGETFGDQIEAVVIRLEDFFVAVEQNKDLLTGIGQFVIGTIGGIIGAVVDAGTLALAIVGKLVKVAENIAIAFESYRVVIDETGVSIKHVSELADQSSRRVVRATQQTLGGMKDVYAEWEDSAVKASKRIEVIGLGTVDGFNAIEQKISETNIFGKIMQQLFEVENRTSSGRDSLQEWVNNIIFGNVNAWNDALKHSLNIIDQQNDAYIEKVEKFVEDINNMDFTGSVGDVTEQLDKAQQEYEKLLKEREDMELAHGEMVAESMKFLMRNGNAFSMENLELLQQNQRQTIQIMEGVGTAAADLAKAYIMANAELDKSAKQSEINRINELKATRAQALAEYEELAAKAALADSDRERKKLMRDATIELKKYTEANDGLTKAADSYGKALGISGVALQDMGTNMEQADSFTLGLTQSITRLGQTGGDVFKALKKGVADFKAALGADIGLIGNVEALIEAARQQTKGFNIAQRAQAAKSFVGIEADVTKVVKERGKTYEKELAYKVSIGEISVQEEAAEKNRVKLANARAEREANITDLVAQRAVIDSDRGLDEESKLLDKLKEQRLEYDRLGAQAKEAKGEAREQLLLEQEKAATLRDQTLTQLEQLVLADNLNSPIIAATAEKQKQLMIDEEQAAAVQARLDEEARVADVIRKGNMAKAESTRLFKEEIRKINDLLNAGDINQLQADAMALQAQLKVNNTELIAAQDKLNALKEQQRKYDEGAINLSQEQALKLKNDVAAAQDEVNQLMDKGASTGDEIVAIIGRQFDAIKDVRQALHDSNIAAEKFKLTLENIKLDKLKNELDLGQRMDDLLDKIPEMKRQLTDGTIPAHWRGFFKQLENSTKKAAKDFAGIADLGPDSVQTVKNRLNLLEQIQEQEAKVAKIKQDIQEKEAAHKIAMTQLEITQQEAIIASGDVSIGILNQEVDLMKTKVQLARDMGTITEDQADALLASLNKQEGALGKISGKQKRVAEETKAALGERLKIEKNLLKELQLLGASEDLIRAQKNEVARLEKQWNDATGAVGEYNSEVASGEGGPTKVGGRTRRQEKTGENFKRMGSESRVAGKFVSSFIDHLTEPMQKFYKEGVALLKSQGKDVNAMLKEAAANSNWISRALADGEMVPYTGSFGYSRRKEQEDIAMRSLATQIARQGKKASKDAEKQRALMTQGDENASRERRTFTFATEQVADNTSRIPEEDETQREILEGLLAEAKATRLAQAEQHLSELEEQRAFAEEFVSQFGYKGGTLASLLDQKFADDAGDAVEKQAAWEAIAALFGEEAADKLAGVINLNKDFVDALKEGTVQPEDLVQNNKVFLDPESGEIILTGKDPNFEKLQELVELVSLKQINEDQLGVLNQIAGNTGQQYNFLRQKGVIGDNFEIFGLGYGTEKAVQVDQFDSRKTLEENVANAMRIFNETLEIEANINWNEEALGSRLDEFDKRGAKFDPSKDFDEGDNAIIADWAEFAAYLMGDGTIKQLREGLGVDVKDIERATKKVEDLQKLNDEFYNLVAAQTGYDANEISAALALYDNPDYLIGNALEGYGGRDPVQYVVDVLNNVLGDKGVNIQKNAVTEESFARGNNAGNSTITKTDSDRVEYTPVNKEVKRTHFDDQGMRRWSNARGRLPYAMTRVDDFESKFGLPTSGNPDVSIQTIDAAVTAWKNWKASGGGDSNNNNGGTAPVLETVEPIEKTGKGSWYFNEDGDKIYANGVTEFAAQTIRAPAAKIPSVPEIQIPQVPSSSPDISQVVNNETVSQKNGGNNAGNTNVQIINMSNNLGKGLALAGTEGI